MKTNKKSVRDVIGDKLVELARNNEKIVVISADMVSTCRLKKFEEEFPKRLFNVGIAEQNMISFAAGLAHEGFIPIVFTMAPFMSMRACEQIRTDVAYENLNVKLISPYSGCSGGISGPTHWGMEDYAILSSFPNMTIVEPSDAIQAQKLLEESINMKGPVYIRCATGFINSIYDETDNFSIGSFKSLCNGKDLLIVATGFTVSSALKAAGILKKKHNIETTVIDLYTLKPFNRFIISECEKAKNVLIIQDHNINNSIGQQIASNLFKFNIRIKILGIPDTFNIMAHSEYIYKKFGYDTKGIVKSALELLEK